MQSQPARTRVLYHGPFGARQSELARDAVCAAADAGVRDILHVVANRTARSAVLSALVKRRGAVFGLRVVTLQGLPREIERRARSDAPPLALGVVEDILLERAIRTTVRKHAPDGMAPGAFTGLARAAARTIREAEQGGGTCGSLAVALKNIGRPDRGATILLDAWTELVQSRGLHARTLADVQRSAIELLRERGDALLSARTFIALEDLPLSGSLDRDLIVALLSHAESSVVATSEFASQLESAPATLSYRFLRSADKWDERPCNRDGDPLAGAGLRVFGTVVHEHDSPQPSLRIVRLHAAGEAAEIRLAARVARRHLRCATADRPMRASDILIIARGSYRELLCETFAEQGIGVNATPARPIADSSVGSVLLGLLRLAAAADGGTRDEALALLRSPHLDVGGGSIDRLARYVISRGYLGLDGWDASVLRAAGRRGANRVRRAQRALASARQSFALASSHHEMARAVRRLSKALRLIGNAYFARKRAVKATTGNALERQLADSLVRNDNQSWEIIEQILDDTMPALLLADAPAIQNGNTSFAEVWLSLFARALNSSVTQQTGNGDDLVRVAGTSNGDGQQAKVTIILGLRQQQFPRQPRQDAFLRDSLRKELRAHGIEMTTSEDATDSERESFVRAIASAEETLYLSYPATDADGKPAVASFFMEDLQRAVGMEHQFGMERLGVSDVVPSPEDATSRADLLAAVAHGVWQRLPATPASDSDRAASFTAWNDLLTGAATVTPVTGRRTERVARSFDRAAMKHTPHSTLELSASQLKWVQHCTFQHFVETVLRPANLATPEYDGRTRGSLVHEAMVQWVRLDGWHRAESALPELDRWFERRCRKLPPAVREGSPAQFMMDEDRERLNAFIREELRAIAGPGAAKPSYNELAFGERMMARGTPDPASSSATFDMSVETSLGTRNVKFTGSIDRVDTYDFEGVKYGIALDYKTGETSSFYAKSMLNGTDLQVRLYMLALERLWDIKPVGALYVGFGDGARRGAISEDAADRIGEFDSKCVTVMARDAWDEFVHTETQRLIEPLIERLVSFDIVARPHGGDCGFCELAPVCRYDARETATLNG